MRAWRRDGTRLLLELTDDEQVMLSRLVEQVRQVFVAVHEERADLADPVVQRLFPDAYADADAAAEFRSLTTDDAAVARLARQDVLARDLATHEPAAAQRVVVTVEDRDADAWLAGLGDLRLVLHTRVQQGAEALRADLTDADLAQFQAVVDWLGFAQGTLVEAMS